MEISLITYDLESEYQHYAHGPPYGAIHSSTDGETGQTGVRYTTVIDRLLLIFDALPIDIYMCNKYTNTHNVNIF